jgi:hypothetical protein
MTREDKAAALAMLKDGKATRSPAAPARPPGQPRPAVTSRPVVVLSAGTAS